jgi:hypothetical protein
MVTGRNYLYARNMSVSIQPYDGTDFKKLHDRRNEITVGWKRGGVT